MNSVIKTVLSFTLAARAGLVLLGVDAAQAGEVGTVSRDGTIVQYHIDGKGPIVLMIPSLGRPAADFDDLSAQLVAAGYTAIRPEPRGIGGSVGPMANVTLKDLADDAMATIPGGSGPIHVVGHAFGQRVARMLAAQFPERVRSVVTLAAGGSAPMRPGAREALLASFDSALPAEAHLKAVGFAFFAEASNASAWRDGWYPEVAKMQVAATQATKVEEWWGAGKARMLVIQGLQDTVAPPENGRMIKAEFGDRVTLEELDGAGHAMLPERPSQIARAVVDFLSKQR